MNKFAEHDEPLFGDAIEEIPVPKPPFHHLLTLLDFWDGLSKAQSRTTQQVRDALAKDFKELGISV